MTLLLAYLLGNIVGMLSVAVVWRLQLKGDGATPRGSVIPFIRRPQKRKPKAVSDEEQYKKEQAQAPLDPGL